MPRFSIPDHVKVYDAPVTAEKKAKPATRNPVGRPKGYPRTGGKQAGTPNKKVLQLFKKRENAFLKAAAHLTKEEVDAMSPLDIILRTMRICLKVGDWRTASTYAKEAAPYVHARLTNTTLDANVRRSAADYSDDELLALAGSGMGEMGVGETPTRPN